MKKIVTLVLILVATTCGLYVSAQAVTLPYQVNFEANETSEISRWTLNPGGTSAAYLDKWVVGNSVHSAGRQALYISNNGQDALFDSVPCVQYAYRDVVLPQGQCILTFDWMCIGADAPSSLYVGVGTSLVSLNLTANTNGILPSAINNNVAGRMISTLKDLRNQDRWKNESYVFTSDGSSTIRIVFAWVSKNHDKSACTMGACIDNIVITNNNCPRPTDISTEVLSCDSAKVSWTGNSLKYEVNYRQVGTSNWLAETRFTTSATDYTKSSAFITNLNEGNYEIRVRGICPPDTSAWMYAEETVVFCPELHCVNFTDLAAPTVICTYGETDEGLSWYHDDVSYNNPVSRNKAYAHIGIVDYGSESILSRHTVNWDKTATDPRTGGLLSLIPKGGYASVRLGNWEWGNGAESITYEYMVDSSNAVVLMQYAVVLQDPDHTQSEQPRFVLEILDENNELIEPTCGVRNFAADQTMQGWHTYGSGYDLITWKDWTTVGLNLRELGVQDGQVIRVRLTTYDCFQGGHFGYAYFTLDCAKATIESASCAKDAAATMTLIAPDGFKYQWYDKTNTKIPGATTRIYEPQDTATYHCRLTSTENANCYFDLYSACVPRLPAPEFTWTDIVENCMHTIDINNRSHTLILQKNDTIVNYSEGCSEYVWNISGRLTDGTSYGPYQNGSISPQFFLPAQGGHFVVTLTASLVGGCDSTLTQEFDLQDATMSPQVMEKILCRPVNDPTAQAWLDELGIWVPTSGQYTKTYTAVNGCDSVVIYDVKVGNTYNIHLGDTVLCYGETLQVGNMTYDSRVKPSGLWADVTLKTTLGCDSFVYYNVRVTDPIAPVITCNGETVELPDGRVDLQEGAVSVDLNIGGTGFNAYTVTYTDIDGKKKTDAHTPADVLLADLPVNEYVFVFSNADGCELRASVLVGGDTLCVNLLSQIECECGKPVLNIPYRKCQPANKARLSVCSVLFSDADKAAQGFEDVKFTGLHDADTLRIAVPAGAEPGVYAIDLIFDTVVGGCQWGGNAFHTAITLTYDSSVIFHRWEENAIISLAGANAAKKADGTDYALYQFDEFQWLVNGQEVVGANRSYMEQPGKLNMSDRFALRMKRTDGLQFTTCQYVPGLNKKAKNANSPESGVSVAPTDPMAGTAVQLSLPNEADIDIYSLMGNRVMTAHLDRGISSLIAPTVPGMYILNVRMNGEVFTLMLRVR